MNRTISISLLVLAFVAGFLIFYRQKPAPVQEGPVVGTRQAWETMIDDQGNVSVVVTPLNFSPQSAVWKFDVGMNTHSVELDQDMVKSAVLIDDQGKEYDPIKWDGPIGGHHREGILSFNAIKPAPKSVELKITGIADTVRTFTWQLNK